LQGYDVVMLDTAGRLHVDQALMDEMKAVADVSAPQEILLVVDSLTGQDAVNVAQSFTEQVPLTGVVLTRMDGDARGGAALSMRFVTGAPIKFAGTGEKLDAIEPFHPARVSQRILGMGDIVSLVEKAAEVINAEEADKLAKKMAKGQFDLNDLRMQLKQVQQMGGLGAMAGMIPGLKKAQAAMAQSGANDKIAGASGCDHRLDDAQGARAPGDHQRQAQDPHRQGRGPYGAGGQQAPQDASGNGNRDEEDPQDGRIGRPCEDVHGRKGWSGRWPWRYAGRHGRGSRWRPSGSGRRSTRRSPAGLRQFRKKVVYLIFSNFKKGKVRIYGNFHSSFARWLQEASLLPHRRCRRARAA
jgi:hypothetical protein